MTNRELFLKIFGRYASEVWALPEEEYINWTEQEAPCTDKIVHCKDCEESYVFDPWNSEPVRICKE